jgi:glycopeptide antibiotics resistance protein
MGKREVRVIVVRRGITVALVVLLSIGMLALIGWLSGKAYSSDSRSVAQTIAVLLRIDSISRAQAIAALMPLAADVIAFVPWGFFAFLALSARRARTARAYVWTCALAVLFSLAMVVWQYALPTRVTTFADTIFTTAGALAGAALGHVRRAVRIRFD